MASLIRSLALRKTKRFLRTSPAICNAIRNAGSGEWQYQHKPCPYPKTPEERAKAAKRYEMTVEEYEPYPEEMGFGDYPKLPDIGGDSKDPFYPWDFPEQRRNFKEPMHVNSEYYGMDRYDPAKKLPIPIKLQWASFFGVMAGFTLLYFYLENPDRTMQRPVCKRQMPCPGVLHYTFEPNTN